MTIASRNPMPDHVVHRRPKLAFLTNVVAPYRIALMEHLGRVFETTILYSARPASGTAGLSITASCISRLGTSRTS